LKRGLSEKPRGGSASVKGYGADSLVASGAFARLLPPLRLFLVGVLLYRWNFLYLVDRINFLFLLGVFFA